MSLMLCVRMCVCACAVMFPLLSPIKSSFLPSSSLQAVKDRDALQAEKEQEREALRQRVSSLQERLDAATRSHEEEVHKLRQQQLRERQASLKGGQLRGAGEFEGGTNLVKYMQ